MLDNVLQRLAEVERSLANIFLIGTIIDADYANALLKVAAGQLETGWLAWITPRANQDIAWWAPEVGEQVVVMCPGGDPELGVVLPAIYQNKYPAPANKHTVSKVIFADGTSVQYDRESHLLTLDVKGSVSVKTTGNTEFNCQGKFKVTAARVDLN